MNRKPLSYESLKSVIQYMNPNARFQIQTNCRTLRVTEKLIPLKIQNLKLDSQNLVILVDGTSYKLGMITHYHKPDGTLDRVAKPNKAVDYDRYGFKDRPADITPGDIVLGYMDVKDWDSARQQEDNQLNEWERRLIKLAEDRVEKEKLPKTLAEVMGLEYIDRQVKEIREQMLPYQLRRDNGQPQLSNYLQLITKSPNYYSEEKIEHVEYNRKLGEAMKYLTSKLLGGRSSPVLVDCLDIRTFGCYRLPQNLKLEVQTMSVNSIGVFDAFQEVLDKKSFPLKKILMRPVNDFDHPIIKSAGKLVINGKFFKPDTIDKVAFASQRVHFDFHRNSGYEGHVISLMKQWRERKREIGTHYSFVIDRKEEVQKELDKIKKQIGAKFGELEEIRLTPFPKCVTYPLNEYSEINVYGEQVQQRDPRFFRWALHVKVQPIGEATPLNEEQPPAKRAKLSKTRSSFR